jgi:phenylalanyl-tRNA synthetase beta chain
MDECVTWSFLSAAHASLFGGGDESLRLINPISADLDQMRPSLLPNLIIAVGQNADRGAADTAFFEVGPQYADDTPDGQGSFASGVRAGLSDTRHWNGDARPVDVFDAKADSLAALEACGAPVAKLQLEAAAPAWYHPGRSGTLQLGPKNLIAHFGEIHPGVLRDMDVAGPVVGFEINLGSIPLPKAKASRNRAPLIVSDLPAVVRDFAFVVAGDVPSARIVQAARKADPKLITDIAVFDVFTGGSLGEDQKSVAIAVRLQPTDATLTDDAIEALSQKIVASVTKSTGASLRG